MLSGAQRLIEALFDFQQVICYLVRNSSVCSQIDIGNKVQKGSVGTSFTGWRDGKEFV